MTFFKKWKSVICLAGITILIIVVRFLWGKLKSNKDTEQMRLTIGHLEAEAHKIKSDIKASEERRKKLKEKHSRVIKVLLFFLAVPALLWADYPLWIDGEWRDLYNCTNAVDYLVQDRQELTYQIEEYKTLTRNQSNTISLLKELNKTQKKDSALTGVIYAWLPPIAFMFGVWAGLSINRK